MFGGDENALPVTDATDDDVRVSPVSSVIKAAVLVGFLNHIASKHGADLGLYLSDLYPRREAE
jgi:hypothetical protein